MRLVARATLVVIVFHNSSFSREQAQGVQPRVERCAVWACSYHCFDCGVSCAVPTNLSF